MCKDAAITNNVKKSVTFCMLSLGTGMTALLQVLTSSSASTYWLKSPIQTQEEMVVQAWDVFNITSKWTSTRETLWKVLKATQRRQKKDVYTTVLPSLDLSSKLNWVLSISDSNSDENFREHERTDHFKIFFLFLALRVAKVLFCSVRFKSIYNRQELWEEKYVYICNHFWIRNK